MNLRTKAVTRMASLTWHTCWVIAAALIVFACLEAGATSTVTVIPSVTLGKGDVLARDLQAGVESSVLTQLARQMGLTEDKFTVHVESLRATPDLTIGDLKGVQVLGLGAGGAKRIDGLFSAPAVAVARDGRQQEIIISGVLQVTGPSWVASKPLMRGHEIAMEDLRLVDLPWKTLPSGACGVPIGAIMGQRVKSHIPAGTAIYGDLIDEPFPVKSGDFVEVTVLSGPGVIIRSRAQAKQEGRMGDQIRLEQPDTKKLLSGTVIGDKSVEVRL